jgi:putative ABC transport system permease protein
MLRILWDELRVAVRTLSKSPAFASVAVLSLALGIGANSAIFTLLDQVLLRPLPVPSPNQLVVLKFSGAETGSSRTRDDNELYFSYPMYRDLRDKNTVFSGMLATIHLDVAVNWRGQTEPGTAELVSGNYFDVLRVPAVLGRTLQQSDDVTPEASPVAVLSHGFWKRRFGGDPAAVNQVIRINDHPFTVIGVAPAGFRSVFVGDSPDIFTPMMMKPQITPGWNDLEERRSKWLNIVGRLKPGLSLRQAEATLNPLWYSLREMELGQIKNPSRRLQTEFLKTHLSLLEGARGLSPLRKDFAQPLLVLMAMVGLVLLIACANVAGLLLARGAARQKEITIRFALGASRGQVIRQLLTESLLLAAAGGLLGILIATWGAAILLRALPAEGDLQFGLSSDPDPRTLVFTIALSLITGIIFGLAPAFQAAKADLSTALKNQAGSVSGGRQAGFRKVLVAAQTGLSLLLMVSAGLFARSLYNLKIQNIGLRPDHLLAFHVDPKLNGYSSPQIMSLYDRLLADIQSLPGVRSVAASRMGVLANRGGSSNITVAGYQAKEGEDVSPHMDLVSPGFVATLGIPLVAGREFTSADGPGAPKVAMVNEAFARYFFGKESAVGRWFGFGEGTGTKVDIQIVGVVKDSKYQTMREETMRFLYIPYRQDKQPAGMTFYVRTSQDPVTAAAAVRSQVRHLDPSLPIDNLKAMNRQIDESLWLERVAASLSMSFGVLASALAAIGLYGVLAFTMARRPREIGIRLALGATRGGILKLVIVEAAMIAGWGIAAGIPISMTVSRYLKSQLFGLSGADALTLAAAALFLALVGLVAGLVPARRATQVDPVTALRWE